MSDNMENNKAQPEQQPNQQSTQPTPQPQAAQPAPAPQTAPQPAPQAAPQPAPAPQAAPQPAPAPQPKQETPTEKEDKSEEKTNPDASKPDKTQDGKKDNKGEKKKRRKTDWGGRIITAVVALLVGIVLGIASVYGTVAAVIYSIGTQSVSKSVALIDTLTLNEFKIHEAIFGTKGADGKYTGGFLSGAYADEEAKIKDLIEDVSDVIGGLGDGSTLGHISAISPFVGNTVKGLLENPNFSSLGIPFEYEKIMSAPFAGAEEGELILADYLVSTFMKTPVGSFIGAFLEEGTEISPLITALCYGQEGVDYVVLEDGTIQSYTKPLTINDFFASDILSMLDNVPLDVLLTVDVEDPLMRAIAYGANTHYTLTTNEDETKSVQMNQMRLTYKRANNEYVFFDANDIKNQKEITYTSCDVNGNTATLTFETGRVDVDENPIYKTWYVDLVSGNVWQDEERAVPLLYSKVTIGALRNDAASVIEVVSLPDIIQVDESNPGPIKAIVYAADGTPRTIEDLRNNANEIINGMKVAEVLDVQYGEGSPLESIIFKQDTDDKGNPLVDTLGRPIMRSLTIKELGDDKDIIDNIKLADVLTVTEDTHPAIQSIIYQTDDNGEFITDANGEKISNTLKDLTSNSSIIDKIRLDDVITVNEDTHPALKSIIYQTDDNGEFITDANGNLVSRILKDLSEDNNDIINGIKLSDVMDTTDSMLLSIIYEEGYVVDEDGKVISGKSRTLKDFSGDGAQDIVNGVKLADVLDVKADSHPALIFLAYGSDEPTDTPRTLGEIRDKGDDLINEIPLSYIITPNFDDKVVTYLIYGLKGIHFELQVYEVAGVEITTPIMLQRHIAIYNGEVYNEYGEKLSASEYVLNGTQTFTETQGTAETEDDVTYTLTNGVIQTLTAKDGNVADVYYLVDSEGNDVMFEETTLAEFAGSENSITKLTSRLTARDILGDKVDENAMLKHLADTPIDQLTTEINKLTFDQVFADEIYVKDEVTGEILLDGNGDPHLTDVWSYMLTVNGENKADEYTVIGSMHDLVENMKTNVHDATLSKLKHDGLIEFSGATLEADLKSGFTISGVNYTLEFLDPKDNTHKTAAEMFHDAEGNPKQTLGELTVEEMIIYVDGIVEFLNNISD